MEKANEKRDGEPGSPIRITVPLDAAESGRGLSGEDSGLSLSGARARRVGFFRRPVRPPEGRITLLGACGSGLTGAAVVVVFTQRSGAEY